MVITNDMFGTYLGVGAGLLSFNFWGNDVANASSAGFTFGRCNSDVWDVLQPTPGTFNWTQTDTLVSTLNNSNKFLFTIPIANKWNSGSDTHVATKELVSVYNFCYQLALRYQSTLTYYEVWNEPDNLFSWKPAANATDYVAFLSTAYRALKAGNPNCYVKMGGLAMFLGNWFPTLVAAGIANFTDAWDVHIYPAITPDPNQALAAIRSTGIKKDIWITENNITSSNYSAGQNETQKQIYLMQNWALFLSQGDMTRIYWQTFRDVGAEVGISPEWDGGLAFNNGTLKPSYTTMQTLIGLLVGFTPVGQSLQLIRGCTTYVFKKNYETVLITWSNSGNVNYQFQDDEASVLMIDKDGNQTTLTSSNLAANPITTTPVFIHRAIPPRT